MKPECYEPNKLKYNVKLKTHIWFENRFDTNM